MSQESRRVLTKYWGYSAFRPKQEEIIDSIISGKDTLALLPTGGGKSICFQIPALLKEGTCVVVTPLIALMKDQVQNLKKNNIKAAAIYTGMHSDEIEAVYSNAVAGLLKFLYVSPERLKTPVARDVIARMNVNLLAIDEAHCISQWGYDFRPSYLQIAEIRPIIPETPVLALTATATPLVVDDIMNKLAFKKPNALSTSFERRNLAYNVIKEFDKTGAIIRRLKNNTGSAIVYVRNRRKTRELAEILSENGIPSNYYHAGLDSKTRDTRQNDWTLGRVKVIVATNAFGMGIDKPDVRMVIHYDLPDSIESYFQEAGRAGRDMNTSAAFLYYNNNDISGSREKFESSFPPVSFIRTVYNALGNYFQIPEGSGKDVGFDFLISDFANNYNFDIVQVYNAIRFLEKEGLLAYIQSAGQYSRLFVPVNKEDLYRYIVENPGNDRLLKEIMRSYAGVFTEYVNINETLLAKRAESSREKVIEKLTILNKQKIISYIPIKTVPQIIFTYERINANYLRLSDENYKNQKNAAKSRLESLFAFVQGNLVCRSQLLLEYFGEKNAPRCGICDVCQAKSKLDINDVKLEAIEAFVKSSLSIRPKNIFELISETEEYEEDMIIEALRWMIEKNLIVRLPDEKLSLPSQLDISFE